MMVTVENIAPVLYGIYGKGSMVTALAEHLVEKIERFEQGDPMVYGDEDQQLNRMLMLTIWNWYPGGGTAQIAADRVEEAIR